MTEKRKVNRGANKGKIGRPPPQWLINLPNGEYTAKQLEELSGRTNRTVRNVVQLHGVIPEYKFNGKAIEGIYKWNGFDGDKNNDNK